MSRWRSLRIQFAAAAAALTLVVVAIAGAAIALGIDQRDRSALDAELASRLVRVQDDLPKMLDDAHSSGDRPGSNDAYGGLLAGSDSTVRLIRGDTVVASRGAGIAAPAPTTAGFADVLVAGSLWRSYVIDTGDGVRLQALQSLAPFRARLINNSLLVVAITVVAAVLAAFGGWFLGRRLVRPLERLRNGALALNTDLDSDARLPLPRGPQEVVDLAGAFDALIDRLHRSALSARRFAADAGHELRTPIASVDAYLELLARPELEPARRVRLAEAAHVEHARTAALLDGLQALARGDAGALPSRALFSLLEVTDAAAAAACALHPAVQFEVDALADPVDVEGWADGIRRAIDNLIENAATHGRTDGRVALRIKTDERTACLIVDDDGPGIPADQRERVIERFARGSGATAPGSGLGLAIVAQQAGLHGGTLELTESPAGGLRAILRLPRR